MSTRAYYYKPWYLFLLPLFFVFHGFQENYSLIPFKDISLLLLTYFLIVLVLAFLSWLYFRNISQAAFFSFLLMSFNLFFGIFYDYAERLFHNSFITKYSVILLLAGFLFVALAIVMKRKRFTLYRGSLYLNVLFSILILIDGWLVVQKSAFSSHNNSGLNGFTSIPSNSKDKLPDVYLIIADEYAGNKDLIDICGFDNKKFIDSLRANNFFVADNSRSNYNYTIYSMASMLNMDYLKLTAGQTKRADHSFVLKEIFNNKIVNLLRAQGYDFYNFSSFDMSGQPSENNSSFIPSRTELFTSQTLYNRLRKDVWLNLALKFKFQKVIKESLFQNMNYNAHVYDQTKRTILSKATAPKFVYTHLELPHYPYYYDSTGKMYSYEEIMKDAPGNTKNYVQYLKYTNKQLLELVDAILKQRGKPPIIILMSDHGYRCFPDGKEPYAFKNFFSVYLPDRKYELFSDSLTNVNVLRTVLNTEFYQRLPLLKDTTITISGY